MRKLFSFLLCIFFVLTLSVPVFARENTLQIDTLEAFLTFAENCRLDSYSQGLQVSLTADIDLTGTEFSGIPIFCGRFNGNGHTLSGVELTAAGSVTGLFRYVTDTAQIENLTVTGTLQPQGSGDIVGGIAGSNAGVLRNCHFSGSISGVQSVGGIAGRNLVTGVIESCSVAGTLTGDHFIGGIAGENFGILRSCRNSACINTTARQNNVALDQITLETLTGAESAATVTDIGGIAGSSAGVIRNCVNTAPVGYPHIGYNIGGIAGSQMGFISHCSNSGTVSGRKEVGGIVGQMEPAVQLVFTEDTLQTLKGQLDTLGTLTDQAASHAQSGVASVQSHLTVISDQTQLAQDAIALLLPDEANPTLPDADQLKAAQSTLASCFGTMRSSVNAIGTVTGNTASVLGRDMDAIARQIGSMEATIGSASENLGVSVTDISDLDTPEDTSGKVNACQNFGTVSADWNVGGIAGAMAPENDLDPDADVTSLGETSLNASGELRTVITACTNRADVTAAKQAAGGIVGWMALGLVKNCTALCNISAENAVYAGGIAGMGLGCLRLCNYKGTVTALEQVGGIAGIGQTVSDCRSMALLCATEKVGGIAGWADTRENIANNFYLPVVSDPGGIDGVSYQGCAQALAEETFFALEGLHPSFSSVTVCFLLEDGQTQKVTLAYGQSLSPRDIPAPPEKEGYVVSWEGLTEEPLVFDRVYSLTYTSRPTVIASEDARLLAEGSFLPGSSVTMAPGTAEPVLTWGQTLLQSVVCTVPDSTAPVQLRCRLPENCPEAEVLVLDSDGSWHPVDSRIDGSYVVFSAQSGETAFALVQPGSLPWIWIASIAGGLTAAGVLAGLLLKKKPKAQK